MAFQARQLKRQRRPQKMRAFAEQAPRKQGFLFIFYSFDHMNLM